MNKQTYLNRIEFIATKFIAYYAREAVDTNKVITNIGREIEYQLSEKGDEVYLLKIKIIYLDINTLWEIKETHQKHFNYTEYNLNEREEENE